MKYLIIDTETSGLPDFKLPADDPSQPRLAAATFIPADDEHGIQLDDMRSTLVRPDGWEISPEITAINGLTTKRCADEGRPVALVLEEYSLLVLQERIVVAYNAQFDTKIMRGELRRAGMPDLFEETPNICLMRTCQKLGIKNRKGRGFPSLADAHSHFFGGDPPEQHTSLADATSASLIFRVLKERQLLPEPQIHYARNRPEASS